jgi:DNA-binding transcriptional LysR family regulator
MELRHLRCFVTVAEELHFARAARCLRIEQSQLSQAAQELNTTWPRGCSSGQHDARG